MALCRQKRASAVGPMGQRKGGRAAAVEPTATTRGQRWRRPPTRPPAPRCATRLVAVHLGLAYGIAARYHRSGPGSEDIRQVAALALVEAVGRFDPGRGMVFSAFAAPPSAARSSAVSATTAGWSIRRGPSRTCGCASGRRPIRSPSSCGGLPPSWTLPITSSAHRRRSAKALRADEAARPLSLYAPVRATDDTTMAAMPGIPDSAYTHVEDVEMLRPVLGVLSERARRVLAMRFADGLTQSEIAKRVGCSQMHIYRILRASLDQLRRGMRDRPAARTVAAGSGAFPRHPDPFLSTSARQR